MQLSYNQIACIGSYYVHYINLGSGGKGPDSLDPPPGSSLVRTTTAAVFHPPGFDRTCLCSLHWGPNNSTNTLWVTLTSMYLLIVRDFLSLACGHHSEDPPLM